MRSSLLKLSVCFINSVFFSPQKTLQQILAEKKKAFSDTNQQQVAAAAAATARSSAGGSNFSDNYHSDMTLKFLVFQVLLRQR